MQPHFARKLIDQGFLYYRQYDSYLEFNADAVLVSIYEAEPVSGGIKPIGNRLINILAGA